MPEFKAVKINETTHWNEKFRETYGITKMLGVYVFDPNECTHCCELTPSYEFNFIHTQVDWSKELNEEEKEEMEDQILESDCQTESIIYMHCSSINRMKTIEIGEFDTIEDAVEYFQGNWI